MKESQTSTSAQRISGTSETPVAAWDEGIEIQKLQFGVTTVPIKWDMNLQNGYISFVEVPWFTLGIIASM